MLESSYVIAAQPLNEDSGELYMWKKAKSIDWHWKTSATEAALLVAYIGFIYQNFNVSTKETSEC